MPDLCDVLAEEIKGLFGRLEEAREIAKEYAERSGHRTVGSVMHPFDLPAEATDSELHDAMRIAAAMRKGDFPTPILVMAAGGSGCLLILPDLVRDAKEDTEVLFRGLKPITGQARQVGLLFDIRGHERHIVHSEVRSKDSWTGHMYIVEGDHMVGRETNVRRLSQVVFGKE
jgi:hypothetical protein